MKLPRVELVSPPGHRDQHVAGAEEELGEGRFARRVHHRGHAGRGAAAEGVEVQHPDPWKAVELGDDDEIFQNFHGMFMDFDRFHRFWGMMMSCGAGS